MKILRIIISLIIIGVAVFLAVDDFKKREFFTYQLKQNSKGLDPVEQWRIKRELDTWLQDEVDDLGMETEIKEEVVTVFGEAADKVALENLVKEWNGLWEKQNSFEKGKVEIEQKARELEKSNLKTELERVNLLLELAKTNQLELPVASGVKLGQMSEIKSSVKSLVKTSTEEKKNDKLNKEEAKEEKILKNQVITPLLETSGNTTESELGLSQIQGSLTDLQKQIKDERKSQSAYLQEIEKSVKELGVTIQRAQENSNAKQSKQLYTYIKTVDQRIQQQLKSLSETIESRDQLHAKQFKLGINQIEFYLNHQKFKLENALKQFGQEQLKPAELNHILLSLSEEKSEARVAGLFSSYRLFVLALIVCFVFNFLWEVISQRTKV